MDAARMLLAALATIASSYPWLRSNAKPTALGPISVSRTLRSVEGHGLVRLERSERGRVTPKVMHDRVELSLPLTQSRKAS
jgi:predicted transcriptional regulator